jgi:hypothetical protein
MTTQLLLRYDSFDQGTHDSHAEDRANAGLTQLQMWREGTGTHWVLHDVNDVARAKAWVDKETGLGHGPAASHMLETA